MPGNNKKKDRRDARERLYAHGRIFAATLVGKNARIQLAFSSEWPSELNNPVSVHTASSECATSAGSILNEVCRDCFITYCLNPGQADVVESCGYLNPG
jgi:hypothetical protein